MTGVLSRSGLLPRSCSHLIKRRGFKTNMALLLSLVLIVTAYLRMQTWDHDEASLLPPKAKEMYERTVHMRHACGQIPPQRHIRGRLNGKRLFYISEKYSLSYCRAPASGSIFLAQVFLTLAGINPEFHDYEGVKSMFDMTRENVIKTVRFQNGLSVEFDDRRLKLTTRFLMARNPYTRLFSSYIDQIYVPTRWTVAGKMAAGENLKRKECGVDIKFEEFLTFVSEHLITGKMTEIYWAPIFSLCLPCETNINIIAKQEQFAEDIEFVLDYADVEESLVKQTMKAAARDQTDTDVLTLIKTYVSNGHSINRGCLSENLLAEKIWTAFQIKGYIHNDAKFPEETFKSIFRADLEVTLTNAILEARAKLPLSPEDVEAQKYAWKLHYWKQVSKETIQAVQAAYYEDFVLFDYDMDPSKM